MREGRQGRQREDVDKRVREEMRKIMGRAKSRRT